MSDDDKRKARASALDTLVGLWRLSLKSPWQPVDTDGMPLVDMGQGFELRAMAYWHCCPRCFATRYENCIGMMNVCSCGHASEYRYRTVRVVLPSGAVNVGEVTARLSRIIKGLNSMHPAHLEREHTRLWLDDEQWNGRWRRGEVQGWEQSDR